MNPAIKRYLEAASGLTEITTAKAEQIARQLVRSGEAASDQVGELADEMMERQRKNQEALSAIVKSETTRAIRAMGLASRSEVERLQKQVADLKRELAKVEAGASGETSSPPARKSAGKKAAAKKNTGKKAAAKKNTGKKAAAKKNTGKKAAKKSSGKKTAAKKSAGKKTAAKKSAGKRAAKKAASSSS